LPPDFEPGPILFPKAQTPPARAGTGIFVGQVFPARASFEDPENPFQNQSIVGPRATVAFTLWKQRFDVRPLFIGEKHVSHPQLFTYSSANSARKIKKSFGRTYETASRIATV
jgi:hypothetical protein